MLPKSLSVLDVIALPDPHAAVTSRNNHIPLNVPYLIYLDEGGEKELKILRLVAGECEVDLTYESWRFLGTCPPNKHTLSNFYSCFLITKKKVQKPAPPPPPPKVKAPPNPESVKARKLAEEREAALSGGPVK
jgi:hypothetical protein